MGLKLKTPLSESDVKNLKIGDKVYLNGIIYTARDMAHIRAFEYLKKGKPLPFNWRGAAVFHAGPICRKKDSKWEMIVIGPTSSYRMEPYEADLIRHYGIGALIGITGMGEKTLKALQDHKAVYFVAAAGCAALHVEAVEEVIDVYWLDLGMPEAVWMYRVKDWGPLIVAMDSHGNNFFNIIRKRANTQFTRIIKILQAKKLR